MFDHHAIVAFVGETTAIVQDVSSGFDPIVTTRLLREKKHSPSCASISLRMLRLNQLYRSLSSIPYAQRRS